MVEMLTSMVSVSVRPACCSCREIFPNVDLFRDAFVMCRKSTCFWSSSNCSCDNLSTTPERRCLGDFGPVASCIASWIFFFKAFSATMKSTAVFLLGIPSISSGEENCCRFFTGVPMERVQRDRNSSPCCFEDSPPRKLFGDEPATEKRPTFVRSRSRRSQDLWSPSRTSQPRSRLRPLSRPCLQLRPESSGASWSRHRGPLLVAAVVVRLPVTFRIRTLSCVRICFSPRSFSWSLSEHCNLLRSKDSEAGGFILVLGGFIQVSCVILV